MGSNPARRRLLGLGDAVLHPSGFELGCGPKSGQSQFGVGSSRFGARAMSKDSLPAVSRMRRRYSRVVCLGRCFARIGDGWEGSVLDLSPGGMLLRVKKALNLGSAYLVKLFLGQEVAVVEARVVRLIDQREEFLVGMEFSQVSPGDLARLQTFVRTAKRGASERGLFHS